MYWLKRLSTLVFCCIFVACTPTAHPTNLKGKIVFCSNRTGNSDIYTIDPNGQNLRQLTDNPGRDCQPKWSPDGQKIVFMSDRHGQENQIYIMDADGKNQNLLTDSHYMEDFLHYSPGPVPIWSPDGKEILFSNGDFVLFNIETGENQDITSPGKHFGGIASWSPDGKQLVFSTGLRENLALGEFNDSQEITTVRKLDTTFHIPYSVGGFSNYPEWSPDGTQIAFTKTVIQGIDFGPFQKIANDTGLQEMISKMTTSASFLFTIRPNGSGMRQITDQCGDGAWSPDNQWLVCTSFHENNKSSELYLVNVVTGDLIRLTDTPYDEYAPDWSH